MPGAQRLSKLHRADAGSAAGARPHRRHRLATEGVAVGIACEGCLPLPDLMKRYEAAGGRYYVCPICFDAKKLDQARLISGAEVQGTVPMVEVDR